jgi:hypothetical protein
MPQVWFGPSSCPPPWPPLSWDRGSILVATRPLFVWLASTSPGAEVRRIESATIAAFVHRPDPEFFNNVVLGRGPADLEATLGGSSPRGRHQALDPRGGRRPGARL